MKEAQVQKKVIYLLRPISNRIKIIRKSNEYYLNETLTFSVFFIEKLRENNRSKLGTETEVIETAIGPPCQDEGRESSEVLKCCELLSNTFNYSNIQPIMGLMKHSLDLSRPWIPQYHQKLDDSGTELNSDFNRNTLRKWLVQGNDLGPRLFQSQQNINFFQEFG